MKKLWSLLLKFTLILCFCHDVIALAKKRIVGGDVTKPEQFPSYVYLHIKPNSDPFYPGGYEICGGVYIHMHFVLTAAHCLDLYGFKGKRTPAIGDQDRINASMGFARFSEDLVRKREWRQSKRIVLHPDYINNYMDLKMLPNYDVALIQLNRPFDVTSKINIAYMADNLRIGDKVVVVGFGQKKTRIRSHVLNKVALTVTSVIRNTFLCSSNSGKNPCRGDAGGPVYLASSKQVVGLVSRVPVICESGITEYVNLLTYRDWISLTTMQVLTGVRRHSSAYSFRVDSLTFTLLWVVMIVQITRNLCQNFVYNY